MPRKLSAVLLLLPLAVSAAPDAADPPEAPVGSAIPPAVAARAGLSGDELREIARLTARANDAVAGLRARHRETQQTLQDLLAAEPPSEEAVLAQLDRVAQAETAVRKNRVRLMLEIRRLLGPKWDALQRELEWERRVAERGGKAPTVGEGVQTAPVGGTVRNPVRNE